MSAGAPPGAPRSAAVIASIDDARAAIDRELAAVQAATYAVEWQAARQRLDGALAKLGTLLDAAQEQIGHGDPARQRLEETMQARDAAVAEAAQMDRSPVRSLRCEEALLAALPRDEHVSDASHYYAAAAARIMNILSTVSTAETPILERRLRDRTDPLGRRFHRFGDERRQKLLGFLTWGKRLAEMRAREATQAAGSAPGPASAEAPEAAPGDDVDGGAKPT